MIGEWVRDRTAGVFRWVAHLLVGTGVTPNMVTTVGLLLSAVTAYLAATGRHVTAAIVLTIAGLLDGLDGSLARASNHQTPFGAFWDSTLDRLSESVVCLGILIYFVSSASILGVILVYLAVIGSLLVSYCRARAEGLGIACKAGFMTRFERVFVLTVGLLFGQLIPALALLVVLSFITVLQRVYLVWATVNGRDATAGRAAAYRGEGNHS